MSFLPKEPVRRSVTLNRATDATSDLVRESRGLLRALRVPPAQIRGIGIAVSLCLPQASMHSLQAHHHLYGLDRIGTFSRWVGSLIRIPINPSALFVNKASLAWTASDYKLPGAVELL